MSSIRQSPRHCKNTCAIVGTVSPFYTPIRRLFALRAPCAMKTSRRKWSTVCSNSSMQGSQNPLIPRDPFGVACHPLKPSGTFYAVLLPLYMIPGKFDQQLAHSAAPAAHASDGEG